MTHQPDWHRFGPLEQLTPGSLTTYKTEGYQLVLTRTEDGSVFALDNRCPHEGYPLAQGDLKGCSLTCCWHNWKFDVRTGDCQLGGEGVRAFPTRICEDQLEIDLSEPAPETLFPKLLRSFHAGLYKHENDRVIRDGIRLLEFGYPPESLLAEIARYDALHAEYGSTHALALSADCGRFLERYPDSTALYAIAPVVDMCGEANRRLPERQRPSALSDVDFRSLHEAVESEQADRAEALLLGAFADGIPRVEIENWMYALLTEHFLDFGHQLIYMTKGQELFRAAGDAYAPEIYGSLLYSMVLGTREDTLPYWRSFQKRESEICDRFPAIYAQQNPQATFDDERFVADVLDASPAVAFQAVWQNLEAGVPVERIAEALVLAAAERFLRFDLQVEFDSSVAESWLWVTHRFTFASAVRNAVERYDSPKAIRFLIQACAFIHTGKKMDQAIEERTKYVTQPSDLDSLLAAITSKQPQEAVNRLLGYLESSESAETLQHALEDLSLKDPAVRPIVVAHVIKTTCAAWEEFARLADHPRRALPLMALVRFLASPLVERRVHQTVGTSLRWVKDGEIPRKLTQ